jgi:UDP-2,3-diacylglucosamine hydrolase
VPSAPPVLDLPPMEPTVVVVGDVHLSPEHEGVARRFEGFLDGLRGKTATLILLGDVFDYWVGRKQARQAFARRFLERFAALAAAGTRLAFVAGNRDFQFDGADGLAIDVWPDVVRTTWGARRVALTHGDLLCTADARYQGMRRVLRSAPVRATFSGLPLAASTFLARGLRDLSEREVRRKPYASMGIDYAVARRWLDDLRCDVLVAGHVHTGVHHRLPGEKVRDVLVLKDWDAGGGVVRWGGAAIELVRPQSTEGDEPVAPTRR